MAAFGALGYEIHLRRYPSFDAGALTYFQTHQTPTLHFLMRWVFTELGGTFLVTVLTIAAAVRWIRMGRFKPDGIVILLAIIGGLALMETMKFLYPRPRMFHRDDHLGSSFPSGHVFFALTLYGLFAHWRTRNASRTMRLLAWTAAVLLALLVGFSRVYVGAHYPTDVAAGFALAVPWLSAWIAVLRYYGRRRKGP
jgi:undecaprenyl-diphosphatase